MGTEIKKDLDVRTLLCDANEKKIVITGYGHHHCRNDVKAIRELCIIRKMRVYSLMIQLGRTWPLYVMHRLSRNRCLGRY